MKPLQLILTNARRYKGALIVAALAMLALVGVQLLVPWVIKILLETIKAAEGSLASPDSMDRVWKLTVLVLAVYLARAGLQFLSSYMSHLAGWGVVADTRKHIYSQPAAAFASVLPRQAGRAVDVAGDQ